jgi:hypothetical protein
LRAQVSAAYRPLCFRRKENVVDHTVQPPQGAKPLPDEAARADRKQKRAAREKQQLPNKGEIRRLINELHAELTSNDRETAQAAARLCRALSLRATERLGLIVTGIQPATVPQVTMASITILKGAGVAGKGDAGVTAEVAE